MGIFSSKYITTVATSASRVIEDKTLPNAVKSGTIRAILQNSSIPEGIVSGLTNSIAVRADSMYAYAGSAYTYGLPTGEIHTNTQGKNELLAVLQTLEGAPVALEYHLLGIPNSLHVGWMRLVEQQGYNPATNQLSVLSAAKGKPVFLNDMTIALSQTTLDSLSGRSLDKWGAPASAGPSPSRPGSAAATATATTLAVHSPVQIDPSVTGIVARVTYAWSDSVQASAYAGVSTATLDIAITEYDMVADYFQVKYTVAGVTKYWLYRAGAGTYPTLDALLASPLVVMGEFYPIVHFRHGKAALNVDKTLASYKTSKKLAKYLGLDYDQVADAISENPDVAGIEQAMMMLAVPAVTNHPLEQRYLFEFFDRLYESSPVKFLSAVQSSLADLTGNGFSNLLQTSPTQSTAHAFIIRDALFEMTLSNRAIYKRVVMGSIGAVGSYASALTSTTESVEVVTHVDGSPVSSIQVNTIPCHVYKRQLDSVSYEEITVEQLAMAYNVQGRNHTTVGMAADPILLVPLDSTLTDSFPLPDRETLFSRSLHFVINSLNVQEVKWYQSGWFSVFIQIVAIAIQLWLGIPLIQIVINMAVAYAATKLLGPKVALIISILYGGYQAISNLVSSVAQTTAMIAKDLLELATGLVKIGQLVVMDKMASLQQAYQDFETETRAAYKTLETAQELLENSGGLNPFVIFGESPDAFYNRTTGGGNVGMQAIDGISTYVSDNLRLPTFSQSTGGYYYG